MQHLKKKFNPLDEFNSRLKMNEKDNELEDKSNMKGRENKSEKE